MYQISELATRVGLSRSTLLYYEKLGLISSTRQANGYRAYSNHALQQLTLLQQLQAGGLTLKECQACLETRIDRSLLQARLQTLDREIVAKQQSRDLLASMLGMGSMREWHQALERQAPGAHLAWLIRQGFSEKQALRLKWLSKDMNEHDRYMADFERIFDSLDRLGPGSSEDTLRALHALPDTPHTLLDIGCGRGLSTVLLAEHTQAQVTALDNDEYSLSCLQETVRAKALGGRIHLICASMTELPFTDPFDVLWAEGSAYIMGFENALKSWWPLIRPQGYLVVSDLVWIRDGNHHPQASAFWQKNYPGMKRLSDRLATIGKLGYQILDSFQVSDQAWENYLEPLRAQVAGLSLQDFSSNALADINAELDAHRQHLGEYGYQMFVLRKESA